MTDVPSWRRRTYLRNCRVLAVISTATALFYLRWLLFDATPQNHVLYWFLVAAEVFNVVQSAGFWITISKQRWPSICTPDFSASDEDVDIFITVYGEPLKVVEKTVTGAASIRHPRAHVWVLDDGGSAEIRALAKTHGVGYIHRADRAGAKAGNLNFALARSGAEFVVVFDADQIPKPEFLEVTLGQFERADLAFVQTPQVYRDRWIHRVSNGAHDQQGLFYGPILRGKNGFGATFSCGTNVVYRRSALLEVGGFPQDSITEDLRLSILLLERGYASEYVPVVVAEGLGPMIVTDYFNQQLRWGRGGLEILFKRRPYSTKMSAGQMLQYSLGFLYWFTGWAYLIYLTLPICYLFGGLSPITTPNEYPAHFLPYVMTSLLTIIYASDFQVTFDALWFTLASFPVQMKSLMSTFFGGRATFVVTPKEAGTVSFKAVRWHLLASVILLSAAVTGLVRYGPTPSVFNNIAWIVAHLVILLGFVFLTLRPVRPPAEAIALAEEGAANEQAWLEPPAPTAPAPTQRAAISHETTPAESSRA